MKTTLLVITLAVVLAPTVGRAVVSQTEARRPSVGIEDALTVAKQYVESHHLDVSQHYIDSVKLDLNPRGDRGRRWVITYELNDYAKGGQIILHVYMDRSVERLFGK